MLTGHGGNVHYWASVLGCLPQDIVDMSSNVNPLGPMDGLVDWLRERMDVIVALPQADASDVVRRFGMFYGIDSERVLIGNGTTHFIHALPGVLGTKRALVFGPTYSDYADAFMQHGAAVVHRIAEPDDGFRHRLDELSDDERDCDTIVICNPNNPTGGRIERSVIEAFSRRHPERFVVIDESYLPFSDAESQTTLLYGNLPNVMVLHSMSKMFRIPGLRIGFAMTPNERIRRRFQDIQQPWSVNALAQEAARFLLDPERPTDTFVAETRRYLNREKRRMIEELAGISGLSTFPSETSFLLLQLPDGFDARTLVEDTVRTHRILLRDCSNFIGLDNRYIRISLKTPDANRRIVRWLHESIETGKGGESGIRNHR
ncbi:MAG: threonine-phosphate decarboxylase [Thermodesulfobacteriota bacterium]